MRVWCAALSGGQHREPAVGQPGKVRVHPVHDRRHDVLSHRPDDVTRDGARGCGCVESWELGGFQLGGGVFQLGGVVS